MIIELFRTQGAILPTMLHNFIWDVGADAGDGYDRVDVFLLCREVEFDGSRRDNFGDGERTSPLVIQLLHGVVMSQSVTHTGACQTYFPQPWTRHIDPGSILMDQNKRPNKATRVGM